MSKTPCAGCLALYSTKAGMCAWVRYRTYVADGDLGKMPVDCFGNDLFNVDDERYAAQRGEDSK